MAPEFLEWLNCPCNLSWLDVGCGTGALSEAIFQNYKPGYLCCVDSSPEFLEKVKRKNLSGADFRTGDACELPVSDNIFDVVVSGLALNFFPDIAGALSEMKRVLKKNGTIAAYVWDYAGKMEFLRLFWDAASEVDVNAAKFDEGRRFPICNIDKLRNVFEQASLTDIETRFLDIETIFENFEDYWNPFLGGQGPAPGYLAFQEKDLQDKIRSTIRRKLIVGSNGSIKLLARAVAVRGNYKH